MELMVAIAIVAGALLVMMQQLSVGFRESEHNESRAFAYQRAAAILQEIQNGIDLGLIAAPGDLYALADAAPNVVLTTRRDEEGLPLAPDHPMSGNTLRAGGWFWSRRISLEPHVHAGLYYVKVDVLQRKGGSWSHHANQSQLMSLIPDADAPAQTFDVYVLAIGAAPSLWSDLSGLRTRIANAVQALEQDSRARFRLHWITRLGYGRDPCYAPYVNRSEPATTASPWAYWMPGALGGGPADARLYRGELLGALHRDEGGLACGWSVENPLPVTVADRFNHCLRAPAARALFEQRVASGLERSTEPPLQVLFDLMYSEPERFRGAIFVNLHGAGLPMPPLRNYADAAREPQAHPGVRVVTHPARLRAVRDRDGDGNAGDSDDLELRVYAYKEDPAQGPAVLQAPILVRIYAPLDLSTAINAGTNPTLTVHRLQGGVDLDSGLTTGLGRNYSGFDSSLGVPPTAPSRPYEMHYSAGFAGGADPHTWIRLHNTPLVAPTWGDEGLPASARLYGLEYVPSPVGNGGFTLELDTDVANDAQPKNTARWRIRLPRRLLAPGLLGNRDHVVRVVTQIGTDPQAGSRWPTPYQPGNRSETWAFWAHSADAVPVTERAQFLGDPRHLPYLDCTSASGVAFRHAFNWHFDDLDTDDANAAALWPCLAADRLQDGFGDRTRADAPRLQQLWRSALERSGAVWVNPTGAIGSHLLLGGEIARAGESATGEVAAVELHGAFQGAASSLMLDSVSLPDPLQPWNGEQVLRAAPPATWWSRPWLGELCPDSASAGWTADGNVALGPFRWQAMHAPGLADLPAGTAFAAAGAATGSAGPLMLFDTGTTAATYLHSTVPAGPAAPSPPAAAIAQALNVELPASLSAHRPFSLSLPCLAPPPAYAFTDSYPRTSATLLETHYQLGGTPAAGAIALGLDPDARAFVVPMGLSPSPTQQDAVTRQALMSGLRALHVASRPGTAGRVPGVALPTVLEPAPGLVLDDPQRLVLRWKTDFVRFDGGKYTETHPEDPGESEGELVYRLLVSDDGGIAWLNAVTRAAAEPGSFPALTAERLADQTDGPESLMLATPPGEYPHAEYLFRIEAFSMLRRCHHGWHQVRVLVRR